MRPIPPAPSDAHLRTISTISAAPPDAIVQKVRARLDAMLDEDRVAALWLKGCTPGAHAFLETLFFFDTILSPVFTEPADKKLKGKPG